MQTKDFDIQRYVDIFRKYKWYGLIPAGLVVILLAVASSFLPKVYQSTCIVEVDRGVIENPLKRDRERLPNLTEHLSVFSQNALKWKILTQVADKVGHDKIVKNSDIYNFRKLKEKFGLAKRWEEVRDEHSRKEFVVKVLHKGIELRQKPPRFLVIAYRGTLSNVNAEILNTLVATLLEEKTRAELNQASRNYEFIKAETENYRQKLEEAEARLKEFKEQHIAELPNNMNVNLAQLTQDKSELLSCELKIKELTARLRYIDEQLKNHHELIVSEVRRETNPMLRVLNERIVDMEIALTRLRTNYTELHPSVVEMKGQLEDLKKQREELQEETVGSETSMINPVHQQLVQDKQQTQISIEVLKKRMESLKKRIEENEETVRGMPGQEQQLLTLTRNYEVTANIHNMFLQKLEEVRLQEKLASDEKSAESFNVLEYARASLTPVAPDSLRLLLIITLVGAGMAIGLMALCDFLDDSLKNLEEAKEFINRPLLGTVPSLKK